MNPKAVSALAEKLNRVVDRAVPVADAHCEQGPHRMVIKGDISFTLSGAALDTYHDVVRTIVKDNEWGLKFSEKYIVSRIEEIICTTLRTPPPFETNQSLLQLAKDLDLFSEERLVYVPLSGIQLKEPLELGAVRLIPFAETDVYELKKAILKISPNPPESRQWMRDSFEKRVREHLLGRVCTEYKVVAEPQRAKERAEEESRRAIDLLRFSIPNLFSDDQRVRVGLFGEIIRSVRLSVSIAPERHFGTSINLVGSVVPFEITPDRLRQMEILGVFKLSKILQKPEPALSDLERVLLRSVHWFSSAQTQPEVENQFLSLTTAIETLLTPRDGNPIGTAIAEGVAFLLAEGVDNRRAIVKRVKDLYRLRSALSHGGKKSILSDDVSTLTNIASSLIVRVIALAEELRSQKELLTWIEERRLT